MVSLLFVQWKMTERPAGWWNQGKWILDDGYILPNEYEDWIGRERGYTVEWLLDRDVVKS